MKISPIRWTVHQAASEFDIDRKTLAKRIKAKSLEPGEDGKFSTSQICTAIYEDWKQRESMLRCMDLETDIAIKRGHYIPLVLVEDFIATAFAATRRRVLDSKLPASDQDEILGELRATKLDLSKLKPKDPPG